MNLLLIFLCAAILIFGIIGLIFARIVIYPKRFGVHETYEIEKEKGKINETEYQSWKKEEIQLKSEYGYWIYGLYFPIDSSTRSVILSHGITYTLYGSVKYMKMFRDLGFNIFIYDLRHHGKSGGKNATFGFYEKFDLKTITTWLKEKVGLDTIIGTHGESMGAAISLQHAAIDPRIDFVIEDCSYSDLIELLSYRIKNDYHLNSFPIINIASFISHLLSGFAFEYVSPRKDVRLIEVPVLFIHGAEDDFIPVKMVQDLYENKTSGARKLYVAPNAAHAESYWNNQADYKRIVGEFLLENKII
jgi:uncharacterized protein